MCPKLSELNASDQLAATFVPELLRKEYFINPERKPGTAITESQAALLWIDIVEFSPMCNRLIEENINGVEKLSSILQQHYEFVLNIIAKHGGEPINYAGDGILAAWPAEEFGMDVCVAKAATCSHDILDQRNVKDDLGNKLSIHLVLACGNYQVIEIGGIQKRWMYTLIGNALSELTAASKNRAPNELIISKSVTEYFNEEHNIKPIEHGASILCNSPETSHSQKVHTTVLSADAIQQLQAFVPRTLSFPLNEERLKWIAELRPVTVVFVQLPTHGFDASTSILRFRQALSMTMTIVTKMDGIVNQVWIDEKASNILICFGPPPSSYPDNPERGVRTALEIHDTLKKVNFESSIGVTSGMAYCGILGNSTLRQYTVIGDSLNLASRLAGLKEGIVFVDKNTFNSSQQSIDYIGPVMAKIKGHTNEVPTWHPIRVLNKSKSFKSHSDSIGRDREMSQLVDTFNHVAKGESKIVIIDGETGMGKSSLIFDFKKQVASHERQIYYTKGDAIERLTPYRSLRTVISALVGWENTESVKAREVAVINLIQKYGSNACLLNVVLQLNIPDSEEIKILPVSKRAAATQDFILSIFNEAASICPIAIAIDEAQWLDELSWKLIEVINEKVNRCFIILVIQNAEGNSQLQTLLENGTTLITLGPLQDADIDKLICSKLGVSIISDEVKDPIYKLAKGNPFFSIELAGSMLDMGLINFENDKCVLAKNVSHKNLSLPETVRGVVRMRVDSLGQGSQLAVKVGSVIGDRFETSLVKSIYPIESEKGLVSSFLQEVNQFGLITPTMIENLEGYLFNSATTAEVVYEMTLSAQRKLLHEKSAEWYESNFKDNLMPFYTQLAHHWEEAGYIIKASDYLAMEGARFIGMGYTKQAIDLGIKGISLFGVDIQKDPEKVGTQIGEAIGEISKLLGDRKVRDLLELKKLNDPEMERLITLLTHIGPFAFMGGRLDLFVLMSLTGLKLTLENGNGESTGDVYSMYSIVYRGMMKDSKTAFEWSQLALEIDLQNGGKLFPRVAHVHCWFINHWVKPISETLPIALKGADAGLENGDVMFMCFNLAAYIAYMAHAGKHLEEVVKTGRKHYGINNLRVVHAAFHTVLEIQVAKALQGRTLSNTSLTDEEFDETKDIAFILNTDFINQMGFYYVGKLKINTHFGCWDEAIIWADKFIPIYNTCDGQVAEIEYELYSAISCLYLSIEKSGEDAVAYKYRAEASINKMNGYAVDCPENFLHKAYMLDAIKEGMYGDQIKAAKLFEKASKLALENEFINDHALINEHLLRMQHRLEIKKTALLTTIDALKKWGAYGKATYISIEFS